MPPTPTEVRLAILINSSARPAEGEANVRVNGFLWLIQHDRREWFPWNSPKLSVATDKWNLNALLFEIWDLNPTPSPGINATVVNVRFGDVTNPQSVFTGYTFFPLVDDVPTKMPDHEISWAAPSQGQSPSSTTAKFDLDYADGKSRWDLTIKPSVWQILKLNFDHKPKGVVHISTEVTVAIPKAGEQPTLVTFVNDPEMMIETN